MVTVSIVVVGAIPVTFNEPALKQNKIHILNSKTINYITTIKKYKFILKPYMNSLHLK